MEKFNVRGMLGIVVFVNSSTCVDGTDASREVQSGACRLRLRVRVVVNVVPDGNSAWITGTASDGTVSLALSMV